MNAKREKLDGTEVKSRLVQMLIDFDAYCSKHDLTYFLSYGTLLGAVRHKGFIPWDDDIDLGMPRDDYNRLIAMSAEWDLPYDFFCMEKDRNYPWCYGKISDRGTELENMYMMDYPNMGLFIDVFPIDEIEIHDEKTAKKVRKTAKECQRMSAMAAWKKFWPSDNPVKSLIKRIMYQYVHSVGSRHWQKKLTKLIEKYKSDHANYALQSWDVMPAQWYGTGCPIEFEGRLFNAPDQPEKCLTAGYGDFMRLPPEEKRVAEHDYEVYLI